MIGPRNAHCYNLAFSPDGHWAAIGGIHNQIRLIHLTATELTQSASEVEAADRSKPKSEQNSMHKAVLAPWLNVRQPTEAVRFLDGHTDEIRALTFSPDGGTLASGSWDQTVRLWNMNTGDQPQVTLREPGHHMQLAR